MRSATATAILDTPQKSSRCSGEHDQRSAGDKALATDNQEERNEVCSEPYQSLRVHGVTPEDDVDIDEKLIADRCKGFGMRTAPESSVHDLRIIP